MAIQPGYKRSLSFHWGTPLFSPGIAPRFWGMAAWGFQVGYWESPMSFQIRLIRAGANGGDRG